jgi:hypothetical protein
MAKLTTVSFLTKNQPNFPFYLFGAKQGYLFFFAPLLKGR